MSQYLAVVELSSLDGNNGFEIDGESAYDVFGYSVSSAGDLNGDGFDDIIIGARYSSLASAGAAYAAYVVFGKASGFDATIAATSLDGNNGFKIEGNGVFFTARSVASAGDVNGDGFDDVIVGSPYGHTGFFYGSAYVVFGTDVGFDPTLDLDDLDGDNGFRMDGETGGDVFQCGIDVASAGDVNGDGIADLIVGAHYGDPNGDKSGASYVVFGKDTGFDPTFDLADLNGSNGFRIDGEAAYDLSGRAVASAGDVNGDGFDDLVVGAWAADPNGSQSGAAYVVFGMASGFGAALSLSALNGANGFQLNGEAAGDRAAWSVASAGDVNADGFDDVIVGNEGTFSNSYVVFGKSTAFAATLELSALDGDDGFIIDGGPYGGGLAGWSVSTAGDVNGDGFDDVIVGAIAASPNGSISGTAYVLFGKAADFDATVLLSTLEDGDLLDGNDGFQIYGEAAGDEAGWSVASAGDMNADGFDDLVVGAAPATRGGTQSGASYVIFGSAPGEAVTRAGTSIDNTIHGGAFDDTLSGLGGNDTLLAHDGKDVLLGGSGKDALIGDKGKDDLTGGSGKDVLDGGKSADRFIFTAVSDSTGAQHDTVKKCDLAQDKFDTTAVVAAIDTTVATGTLSKNSFDSDLAAAVGGGQLGIGNAVLFTPDAGNLAGKVFLVIDQNGTAGYQAGADLVVRLDNAQNLGSLGIEDFI